MKKLIWALVFGLAGCAGAHAAGVNTNGMPILVPGGAYNNLTGQEQLPADTGLAAGQPPQTVAPTVAQIAGMLAGATTATASGGAATSNTFCTVVTSEALTTAAAGTYTLTLTNSVLTATNFTTIPIWAQAHMKSSTAGGPLAITSITPANGSVVIVVTNLGSAALNGTIVIPVVVKGC